MIDKLLNKLHKVKKRGDGRYVACCPVHKDRTPSLSIKNDAGVIVMHCFGCGANGLDVCNALGMDPSSLFPDTRSADWESKPRGRVGHDYADILFCLQLDCARVALIAREMADNQMISKELKEGLEEMAERIMTASTLGGE